MITIVGSIASIISLGGALFSFLFAKETFHHYRNIINQYTYTLSRFKSVTEDIRLIKRKFKKLKYEDINEKLNQILNDLPTLEAEEIQIEDSITTMIKRIDECLDEKLSIQDTDKKYEKIEVRKQFKDIDTLYRKVIEIIKEKNILCKNIVHKVYSYSQINNTNHNQI